MSGVLAIVLICLVAASGFGRFALAGCHAATGAGHSLSLGVMMSVGSCAGLMALIIVNFVTGNAA